MPVKLNIGGKGPSGNGAFERPRASSISIIRRLWRYLYRYKGLLIAAIMLSLVSNILALYGPKRSGYAVDALSGGPGKVDFDRVFYYARLMIVFYLISSGLSYLLAAIMVHLARNVVYSLRKDIYEHLMRLPVRFFDTHQAGDIISVLSYDVDTVSASLSNDLVQMLTSIVTVTGSFLMMLSISPKLILIFFVTIPASMIFTKYRSGKVRPLFRKRSIELGRLNGFAEEMTGGLRTIKAYGREDYFRDQFEEKNRDACEANYRADAFASMTGPAVNFINNFSLALVSMFGALLYMSGSISLGNVSSFVLYSRKFSGPINEFSNIVSELQSALAAAERAFMLLDEPMEEADAEDAGELTDVRGEVELSDIHFGYGEEDVLKGFSLRVEPGKVAAIVGPTGAGKTTVINLLMRFYDPESGSIRVDGRDIRHIRRQSLRKAYSMVLQDTWLFTGTVYENLAYGKEGVSLEEVRNAAKAARIDGFIRSLPKGYDTVLKDGGQNISKGQKQLLTIARAMLLDAPMLILDEATSNVDTSTEQSIQAAMLKLMEGRTCFVIAHRLSTIQNADIIAVLRDGRIVEQGRHKELMEKRGYYSELYKAQFDSSEALEST